MRTIAAVTVGRSDFGILQPVLQKIQQEPRLRLQLLVAGAHWSPEFGLTVREIIEAGFQIDSEIEMNLGSDTPRAIAQSMGLGMIGFAQSFAQNSPDMLLVVGDRFEMHAAAAAAVPFQIPIAHVHGGEVTHGAIDEAFRHAITKYSHLHFVSALEHRQRVIQLGEEPWRVVVSGAPSLDDLAEMTTADQRHLEDSLGLKLSPSPLLVTFHPVTLQYQEAAAQVAELLAALESFERPLVITKPNADSGSQPILEALRSFVGSRPQAVLVDNLGKRNYFGLMKFAAAMVGNSSSGIIEAASFGLPVVNIGSRQAGRPRSANVIDTEPSTIEIKHAVRRALSAEFRAIARNAVNVFGTGRASQIIVDTLREVPMDYRLMYKQFYDLSSHDTDLQAA